MASPTTYQRVTTDSDYDGDPAKFPYYLKFDGVDDYLSTAAIDLTWTDKVTVFCGAAPDATGYLLPYYSFGNTSASGFYAYNSDYLNVGLASEQSYSPSKAKEVDTYVFDRSLSNANQVVAHRNGMPLTPVITKSTAATGNFGNLVLAVGTVTTFYFQGNLYSLIIGGALYDAATVIEAETWVAEKTGVTL